MVQKVAHKGTVTKQDLADAVYNKIGFSKKLSVELVEFCFNTIKKKLSKNHNVKISNFGHFILRDKKARKGRNPTTGRPITLASRRVVTFRVSPFLRKNLQQ